MQNLTGSSTAIFYLNLTSPSNEDVIVNWQTRDGAAKAGIHYEATKGVARFAPGETQADIRVQVYGQEQVTAETLNFYIDVGSPVNAVLGTPVIEAELRLDDLNGMPITNVVVAQGKRGLRGPAGQSAYELAVNTGQFSGTIEQWLEEQGNAAAAAARAEQAKQQAEQAKQTAQQAADNANNAAGTAVENLLNEGVPAENVKVGDQSLDVFVEDIEVNADKIITPMNFGALGDGTGRLVSEFYSTLAEARQEFPNLTSLSLTMDSAACNEWILSTKGSHYLGDKTKHYVLNTDINDTTTQNFLIKFPASRQVWANKAKISILNNCPMFYGIFGNSDASVNLNDSSVSGVIIDHNSQNREYSVVDNVLVKPNFDFCYLNGKDCVFKDNIILNAVQTNSVYANNYALNESGRFNGNTYIDCGSDTIEFDHSTFYTHGKDFEIKDNKGVTELGKKGVACFVEIHSTGTRIQNNYCYGYGGFCNYTGISNVGVLENGIVSGNVFECVQFGVRVFSAKLIHNIGTHGIDGLEIQGNKGKIHQNLLDAGTQKMYIGYGVQAGSNLDVKNLFIKGNSLEYALDTTAQQYDALSCAIGINESSGTAIYENIEIGGNTIINAPIMAIGLGFGGGILKNTHILPNTIINAAQGLHSTFAAYKSAINIAPNKIEGYLKIDEQSITDTLAQTRLVNSVSIIPVVDSTSADIQIAVNTILQGDKASFVRSVANSGNKTLPLISVKLNKQPVFTGHNFKSGSLITNTLNNSSYLNVDNTSVFKLSSSSAIFDPPNIVAGGTITRQILLQGARSGDFIIANFSVKNADIQLSCDVLANDVVTVTFKNNSAADIDLDSGVLTVKAI